MKPLFSLCHASARMHQWEKTCAVWLERCGDPLGVEYILTADEDWDAPRFVCGWKQFILAPNRGRRCAVDAWNRSAEASTGHIIITVSDDLYPPQHWDSKLLRSASAAGKALENQYVFEVDSGGNDDILTFSLLSRAYYERLGYLFYPEYFGMRADNEFSDVARRDGVVINARHLYFEHRHPFYGKNEMDKVYEHQHRPEAYARGDEVYLRRKALGFPSYDKIRLTDIPLCHGDRADGSMTGGKP